MGEYQTPPGTTVQLCHVAGHGVTAEHRRAGAELYRSQVTGGAIRPRQQEIIACRAADAKWSAEGMPAADEKCDASHAHYGAQTHPRLTAPSRLNARLTAKPGVDRRSSGPARARSQEGSRYSAFAGRYFANDHEEPIAAGLPAVLRADI